MKGREEMTELEMSGCSKNKEISKVNDGGQTQSNASAESWLIQVEHAFDSPSKTWQPSMWELSEDVCIYRVPKSIMISKRQGYVPLVVSLGPYHHEINPILTAMDQHKLEAVDRVLKRLEMKAIRLIQEIEKLDSKIRECYDEEICWDEKTLAWMLAMDACFILEFFRSYNPENTLHSDILNDILKLENQIPLFILKSVLKLEFKTDKEVTFQLTNLLFGKFNLSPFSSASPDYALPFDGLKGYIEKAPYHLLDLKRMVIEDLLLATVVEPAGAENINSHHGLREWSINVALPCCGQLRCIDILNCLWPTHSDDGSTPSAELLHKAGINFQLGQIGFESSKISLPQIIVDDNTETVLRNLMAYEECQRCSRSPKTTIISHFVCLLDDLIESEKDVSILKEGRIINSLLGSDKEVADTFNQLCKGITWNSDNIFKFESAVQQAKQHYYSPWKKPIRRVKEAYCTKPLYWVSILAGTAILVMTAVQMAYAIKNG